MPKSTADIECVCSWLEVRSWHVESACKESSPGTLCQHTRTRAHTHRAHTHTYVYVIYIHAHVYYMRTNVWVVRIVGKPVSIIILPNNHNNRVKKRNWSTTTNQVDNVYVSLLRAMIGIIYLSLSLLKSSNKYNGFVAS